MKSAEIGGNAGRLRGESAEDFGRISTIGYLGCPRPVFDRDHKNLLLSTTICPVDGFQYRTWDILDVNCTIRESFPVDMNVI